MSKLILISLLFIPNLFIAQTIKVHVTEAQRHMKWGEIDDVNEVLNNPDDSFDKITINCFYEFDLEQKTSTYWSISGNIEPITLPISDITNNGDKYVIKFTSYGDIDASFTYPVTIYVDIGKESMIYSKYDPYMGRSFAHKLKSTVDLIETTASNP